MKGGRIPYWLRLVCAWLLTPILFLIAALFSGAYWGAWFIVYDQFLAYLVGIGPFGDPWEDMLAGGVIGGTGGAVAFYCMWNLSDKIDNKPAAQ